MSKFKELPFKDQLFQIYGLIFENFLENEAAELAREEADRKRNPEKYAGHAPGDAAGMRAVAKRAFEKKRS